MNIGDRVRLLRGNEEGVITKISSGGRVEIEIEDGFRIPAMKNEVVVISAVEKQYFGEKPGKETSETIFGPSPSKSHTQEGVFLSYIPINDKILSLYLVNNTETEYLALVAEVFGENSQTVFADKLSKFGSKKLGEKNIPDFEDWPPLQLKFFPVHHKIEKTLPSFERNLKFKASSFFKSKGKAPILDKEGYLFKLSENIRELDVKKLNEELKPEANIPVNQFKKPPKEVDLHIEKLTKNHDLMSNSEMLRLQIETFEVNLNHAIASGMDEITFIHGIGNGVLRKEIHKYLSQLGNIKYFQDIQKSRFGYGATLVRIS